MSQENIDVIRRGYEAISRGDLAALKDLVDPDCEIHSQFGAVAGRTYRGHEGVEQWYADMQESWEEVQQTPEQFIEVDAEKTIAVVRFRGRGRGSGVEIDQRLAALCTVREGRGVRLETFRSLDEARAAASVEE